MNQCLTKITNFQYFIKYFCCRSIFFLLISFEIRGYAREEALLHPFEILLSCWNRHARIYKNSLLFKNNELHVRFVIRIYIIMRPRTKQNENWKLKLASYYHSKVSVSLVLFMFLLIWRIQKTLTSRARR